MTISSLHDDFLTKWGKEFRLVITINGFLSVQRSVFRVQGVAGAIKGRGAFLNTER